MNYSVKNKKRTLDFLYPYAARVLGLKNLILTPSTSFDVEYSNNQYCGRNDNADNAMHKVTVVCRAGNDVVKFAPYRTSSIVESYGYNVYVNGKHFDSLTPTEWSVIRPKVYSSFTEYFSEMGITVAAYEKLYKSSNPSSNSKFIISRYSPYLRSFRDLLQAINITKVKASEPFLQIECDFSPVIIKFNCDEIYGMPVHEDVAVMKTIDNRLISYTYSMN